MENLNDTLRHYKSNAGTEINEYNKRYALPYYFQMMITPREENKIADIGCGLVCRLGGMVRRASAKIYASDILKKEYDEVFEKRGCKRVIPIEYQNIEKLTYPDGFFDIVHCVNTIDHTADAKAAISELVRVCKPGGWIYLRHGFNQKKRFRGEHKWNFNVTHKGQTCTISDGEEMFFLDRYGDFVTRVEGDYIISFLNKTKWTNTN